jgi:hypothetical protein
MVSPPLWQASRFAGQPALDHLDQSALYGINGQSDS